MDEGALKPKRAGTKKFNYRTTQELHHLHPRRDEIPDHRWCCSSIARRGL